MSAKSVPLKRKIGALIVFHDLPAVQVWVAAASLGLEYGLHESKASASTLALALLGMGLTFMYLMGVNDLFDVEIDRQKHEYAALVTGAITEREAYAAVIVSGGLGLLFSAFVSAWFLVFALAIFGVATFYSVPPVRFKRFYPFSTVGELVGGYLLFPLGLGVVSGPDAGALLASFVPFLIAASMRLGHEVKYVDFDRATGKRTLAVVHGPRVVGRVVTLLPYLAAAVTIGLTASSTVTVPLGILMLAFIALPQLVRKLIRSIVATRPVSYVWGFLFFLIAILVS